MLSEGRHALLLPLIPYSHFRIGSSSEQSRVVHACAQGRACRLMASERSNFRSFFDIPGASLARDSTSEELRDRLTKDHRADLRSTCHPLSRISLSQLPHYDVVLVVTCCEHVTAIRTDLGTCEIGPTTHQVIVLLN